MPLGRSARTGEEQGHTFCSNQTARRALHPTQTRHAPEVLVRGASKHDGQRRAGKGSAQGLGQGLCRLWGVCAVEHQQRGTRAVCRNSHDLKAANQRGSCQAADDGGSIQVCSAAFCMSGEACYRAHCGGRIFSLMRSGQLQKEVCRSIRAMERKVEHERRALPAWQRALPGLPSRVLGATPSQDATGSASSRDARVASSARESFHGSGEEGASASMGRVHSKRGASTMDVAEVTSTSTELRSFAAKR